MNKRKIEQSGTKRNKSITKLKMCYSNYDGKCWEEKRELSMSLKRIFGKNGMILRIESSKWNGKFHIFFQ